MKTLITVLLCVATMNAFSQSWWEKTKEEAIPSDLTKYVLLVEKFKTEKEDSAPDQAYLKSKSKGHPLIKETNDNLTEYNRQVRTIFKEFKHDYILTSKRKSREEDYFGTDTCKYSLRHVVYLRKYMKAGAVTHFYTYLFYFHDRSSGKDYPYIYLYNEERLKSLEELVGYLNELE